ncbi:hypothetical protein Pcinc_003518 [Petrolisthes cinctipes]|uniref:Uncharacterized protein n=1 Tax=Petrolisthes cinctipes TaxID=88211 RepID=A0AAE1L183_PETCI|nr:hypothetical protein Pcinc_003518 [Petrolisthes cinctipes]
MGELLEVQPVSWRVVSLNAPYLKSLCVFESLSRALGCCYNHHHPQVVSCECWVRLPAARMTRVRGHTSHTMATGHTPTINTNIEMGTYLVFHLADWSKIQQCHLVLHGIEKVPKSHNMTHILLQRVDSINTNNDTQQDIQQQQLTQPNLAKLNLPQQLTQPNLTTQPQPNHTDIQQQQLTQPYLTKLNLPQQLTQPNLTTTQPNHRDIQQQPQQQPTEPQHNHKEIQQQQLTQPNLTTTQPNHKDIQQQPQQQPTEPQPNHKDIPPQPPPPPPQLRAYHEGDVSEIVVNLTEAEEVITLLDDDGDDDGCESDTSDDLHKV